MLVFSEMLAFVSMENVISCFLLGITMIKEVSIHL